MNKIEIKEVNSKSKTDFIKMRLEPSEFKNHYLLYIDDKEQGQLERSDLRDLIENLEYCDLPFGEMLLNGAKIGLLNLAKKVDMIMKIDNLIHH